MLHRAAVICNGYTPHPPTPTKTLSASPIASFTAQFKMPNVPGCKRIMLPSSIYLAFLHTGLLGKGQCIVLYAMQCIVCSIVVQLAGWGPADNRSMPHPPTLGWRPQDLFNTYKKEENCQRVIPLPYPRLSPQDHSRYILLYPGGWGDHPRVQKITATSPQHRMDTERPFQQRQKRWKNC